MGLEIFGEPLGVDENQQIKSLALPVSTGPFGCRASEGPCGDSKPRV